VTYRPFLTSKCTETVWSAGRALLQTLALTNIKQDKNNFIASWAVHITRAAYYISTAHDVMKFMSAVVDMCCSMITGPQVLLQNGSLFHVYYSLSL